MHPYSIGSTGQTWRWKYRKKVEVKFGCTEETKCAIIHAMNKLSCANLSELAEKLGYHPNTLWRKASGVSIAKPDFIKMLRDL